MLEVFKNLAPIQLLRNCFKTLLKHFDNVSICNRLTDIIDDKLTDCRLFLFEHVIEYSETKALEIGKKLVEINARSIISLIDILLPKSAVINNPRDWENLALEIYSAFDQTDSAILFGKMCRLSSAFNHKLNDQFVSLALSRDLPWSAFSDYLSVFYKDLPSTAAFKTLASAFSQFFDHASSIVSIMANSAAFYNDSSYFSKCFKFLLKNHIDQLFYFIENCLQPLISEFGYAFVKETIEKYLHKSHLSFELVCNIRDHEYSLLETDFAFVRSLFDKIVSISRDPSTELFIEFIAFEVKALRVGTYFDPGKIHSVYSQALKTLSGESVKKFVDQFTLLQTSCPST